MVLLLREENRQNNVILHFYITIIIGKQHFLKTVKDKDNDNINPSNNDSTRYLLYTEFVQNLDLLILRRIYSGINNTWQLKAYIQVSIILGS